MKKLLIATHNKAKLSELKMGLSKIFGRKIKILSLDDLKINTDIQETGKNFEENAKIKAEFYAKMAKMPAISDDAGLIIPFLNNEPGVKSRRWLGRESTDEELIDHTISNLRGQNWSNRTAYLEVFLIFFNPINNRIISVNEKIKGHIALCPSKKRIEGYPFRALFIVDKFNKYYDELSDKEHEKINHRLLAVKKLAKKIESLI